MSVVGHPPIVGGWSDVVCGGRPEMVAAAAGDSAGIESMISAANAVVAGCTAGGDGGSSTTGAGGNGARSGDGGDGGDNAGFLSFGAGGGDGGGGGIGGGGVATRAWAATARSAARVVSAVRAGTADPARRHASGLDPLTGWRPRSRTRRRAAVVKPGRRRGSEHDLSQCCC
ncbi:PE family protein [Mycobacterium spongiae]|uniref:PE domain-containing protein n=1 Tax=Mycobacterium spongiae TaxID=886343 RepID=A0A975K424_9MYCO|nr:PE family protein [Mycobacterium spongiae]QUR69443.1 PE domain-containing protein [Mycobacterium spongiae]